jgi:hypothetical protein
MTGTSTIPVTSDPDLDEENRVAHIVGPQYDDNGKIQGRTFVTEAYINGTPITALCGFTWVPSRDPNNYPLCQACKDISERVGD